MNLSPTSGYRARRGLLCLLPLLLVSAVPCVADTLTFKDGEKLHGTYIRTEDNHIIFRSKNVGDLSVALDDAKVEVDPVAPPASSPEENLAEGTSAVERGYSRIFRMGRRVERTFVGWWEPWKGRVAASLDVVNDSKERSAIVLEGRAKREWTHDEVQIEGRYEHRRENGVTTVDLFRSLGNWRHDIGEKAFMQYRPEVDRDSAVSNDVQPFPYMMLQQQVGFGYHVLKQEKRKVRVGVGETFYNVWAINDADRSSRRNESAFIESELQFPWRITATDRAVLHYGFAGEPLGFENEFEFSKKLTDSLSLGVRQEVRKNNPDSRVTDYERVRFLIGYDF